MARSMVVHVTLLVILMVAVFGVANATPPGIANNPSQARCQDPSYKECHNLVHVCPKFCPNGCTVHCQSCKPICIGDTVPSPPEIEPPPQSSPPTSITPPPVYLPPPTTPTPPTPVPQTPTPSPPTPTPSPPIESPPTPSSSPPTPTTPSPPINSPPTPSSPTPTPSPPTPSPSPPIESPPTPSLSPPTPTTPSPPIESPPTPSPPTPTPSPPTPPTPSPSPPTPIIPSPPVESPPTPSPPTPTPSLSTPPTPSPSPPTPTIPSPPIESPPTPSPPTPTPSPPTPSPSPPTPITPSPPIDSPPTPTPSSPPPTITPPTPASPSQTTKSKCKNKNYPQCYATEHVCPSSCPNQCEVDCVACKPVCNCDMPGAVCQDPRFIGADGITFYFHGKKDKDFCLVADKNLHINGHFIGKRNKNMGRDFTWVQSIGVRYNYHKLQISAQKTSTWDETIDRISISYDDENIVLPETIGSRWQSSSTSVTRISDTNNIIVEVENLFKITTKVVPITKEDSKIHNYDITNEDCFAHLDLKFKFFSLSNEVDGVLGQTYNTDYVSKVKMGVLMHVMGGDNKFASGNIFSTDCSVAKFMGNYEEGSSLNSQLPSLNCQSGLDGQGVVCKR